MKAVAEIPIQELEGLEDLDTLIERKDVVNFRYILSNQDPITATISDRALCKVIGKELIEIILPHEETLDLIVGLTARKRSLTIHEGDICFHEYKTGFKEYREGDIGYDRMVRQLNEAGLVK